MRELAAVDLVDPFADLPDAIAGGVVSFGNFDGLHRGHKRIVAALRDMAARQGRPAVIATFEPHPASLLRPERAPIPLVQSARKAELLRGAGVDRVVALRTSRKLLALSAEEFWRDVVCGRFQCRGIVEGHDFTFGKNRTGNTELLKQWAKDASLPIAIVDAVRVGDSVVSSSRIRQLIAEGSIMAANNLLGKPHRIDGSVVAGDRRGAALGFATANLADIDVILPAHGVYAGWARLGDSAHPAACNVGPNPTFGVDASKVEVHLLDFSGDLYGRQVGFEFIERLREVRRFASLEDLKRQLTMDIERTRTMLATTSMPNAAAERRREQCGVIREWLALWYATDEPEFSGAPGRMELSATGELQIEWRHSGPWLPSDRAELLLRLEGKLRAVFPEVARVELSASNGLV